MNNEKTSKNGILAVIVAIISAYAIGMNLGKVSACTSLISEYYNISSTQTGTLVSLMAFVGLVVCFPAGTLVTKFGARKVGLVAVGTGFVGSLMGSLSGSYEMLLASRLLEGVGAGSIATIVTPLISEWISPKKKTIYIGFFSCYIGAGQVLIYLVANVLIDSSNVGSFMNIWNLTTVILAICLVLWFLFVKSPSAEESFAVSTNSEGESKPLRILDGFTNPAAWVLCISMIFFSTCATGSSTYATTYATSKGLDVAVANSASTIRFVVAIGASIVAGLIIAPLNTKKRCFTLFLFGVVSIVAFSFMWRIDDKTTAVIVMVICGLEAAIPSISNGISSEISKDPRLTSITNAFIVVGQNIGTISVAFVTGGIIDAAGFEVLAWVYSFCGVALAALLFVVYLIVKHKIKS